MRPSRLFGEKYDTGINFSPNISVLYQMSYRQCSVFILFVILLLPGGKCGEGDITLSMYYES